MSKNLAFVLSRHVKRKDKEESEGSNLCNKENEINLFQGIDRFDIIEYMERFQIFIELVLIPCSGGKDNHEKESENTSDDALSDC